MLDSPFQNFLLYCPEDRSFFIAEKDLVTFHKEYSLEDFESSGNAVIECSCNIDGNNFECYVLQVAEDVADLAESQRKASDLKFRKKQTFSSLLEHFRRVKNGRDRVPPLDHFLTGDDSTAIETPTKIPRTAKIASTQPVTLPLLPMNSQPCSSTGSTQKSPLALPSLDIDVSQSSCTSSKQQPSDVRSYNGRFRSNISQQSDVLLLRELTAIREEMTLQTRLLNHLVAAVGDPMEISPETQTFNYLPISDMTSYNLLVADMKDSQKKKRMVSSYIQGVP